jgi:hypothetical protein
MNGPCIFRPPGTVRYRSGDDRYLITSTSKWTPDAPTEWYQVTRPCAVEHPGPLAADQPADLLRIRYKVSTSGPTASKATNASQNIRTVVEADPSGQSYLSQRYSGRRIGYRWFLGYV